MTSISCQRSHLIACGLLIAACNQGAGEPGIPGHIRFDHLEVGQHSKYAQGLSEFRPLSSPVSYSQDVLLVEIIDRDDNGFRVRESIVNPPVDQLPRALEYYFRVAENKLDVFPIPGHYGSGLFSFHETYTLPLNKLTKPVLEVMGLQTTMPEDAYAEAAVTNAEVLGARYPHLNAVVDRRAISVDGPAATWLYSATYGIVRSTACGVESGRCAAWDLLPE